MEVAHLVCGLLQRLQGVGVHLAGRGVNGLLRHAQAFQLHAVELSGELAQGGVAPFAHLGHDAGGRLKGASVERPGAVDESAGERLGRFQMYAAHGASSGQADGGTAAGAAAGSPAMGS